MVITYTEHCLGDLLRGDEAMTFEVADERCVA